MSGTSGESTVLTALTLEARRRGTTYGKLVAALSEKEIDRPRFLENPFGENGFPPSTYLDF